MKKQNPDNKLTFNKVAVTELNEVQLKGVNGGTSNVTTSFYEISLLLEKPQQTSNL